MAIRKGYQVCIEMDLEQYSALLDYLIEYSDPYYFDGVQLIFEALHSTFEEAELLESKIISKM